MNYLDQLRTTAKKHNSIVCMGMDPVLEKIPLQGPPKKVITKFFLDILDRMEQKNTKPAIVKPNMAFYEQYGFEGLEALQELIRAYQAKGIPVLLDAKRGDIGKTSQAYAKAIFDLWQADAVTIVPYMGSDSVEPFITYCKKGKGVYIVHRTSNKGAKDIQDLNVEGKPLYMAMASLILQWSMPGVGSVLGATYPDELYRIAAYFQQSGKQIPFLIPGVGSQGGSAAEVVAMLKRAKQDLLIHRINSSSGICFAYEEQKTQDYAGAAVEAIKKLNTEIGLL